MYVQLHELAFYLAIFFTVLGAVLGLIGVWVNNFWENEVAWKMLVTDFILAGSSIVVAAITKWLSA